MFETLEKNRGNPKKNSYQLLHKFEGMMYHNFIKIDRRGSISILTCMENIWFNDESFQEVSFFLFL